jgi:hypothetical protein
MTVTAIFALLGAKALYLLLLWLFSAIASSWLSDRAGYGERVGLATGLLLTALGMLIWLAIYLVAPRAGSLRKIDGVIPKRRKAASIDIDSRPTA